MTDIKICNTCVMDSTDPNISFDVHGVCNHCNNYYSFVKPYWDRCSQDSRYLDELAQTIKQDGVDKDFDCIIGLSGGLDSSYTAYVAKEIMGLRPLLLHVDAGWNTHQAVENIEAVVNGLGLDLYTEVVNWEAVKQMQVAFFKSGIPDQDLVQDAAFFSALYKFARQYKVKHILTGSNFSTECCREPEEWGGYLGIDSRLFNDIWSKFGASKKINFPLVDIFKYKFWYRFAFGMKVHHPLNLIHHTKLDAEELLNQRFGWHPFQHKHHESRFTRFYEDYWLPRRFGFDKRKAHFSSLIMTGQMTRDDALNRLKSPEMSEDFLAKEMDYVAGKLDMSLEDLKSCFLLPVKTFKDFKNKRNLIKLGANIFRLIGLEKRKVQ